MRKAASGTSTLLGGLGPSLPSWQHCGQERLGKVLVMPLVMPWSVGGRDPSISSAQVPCVCVCWGVCSESFQFLCPVSPCWLPAHTESCSFSAPPSMPLGSLYYQAGRTSPASSGNEPSQTNGLLCLPAGNATVEGGICVSSEQSRTGAEQMQPGTLRTACLSCLLARPLMFAPALTSPQSALIES